MKKYILGSLAIILALGFSAFTKPNANITKGKKFTTGIFWYVYGGAQNSTDRQNATNYTTPTASQPPCGTPASNECTVQATVTLDINNNPPANPNFAGASFNSTTGMPIPGTGLINGNVTKL
jgi:hypothetical protein